ncbi:MAG TPA: hypothetical protein VF771_21945, partial [Longimicrobiaceae bacterium]
MRRTPFIPLAALVLWGCSDPSGGPKATNVTITPGSIAMNAVGATQIVHAAVTDQGGKAMKNASLSWSSSSAAATVASLGGDSALVTAAANGSAEVTATAGSAKNSVTVEVVQAAAAILKLEGDQQIAKVGTVLSTPLKVKVVDRLGAPVAGQSVGFNVNGGGS